MKKLVSMLLALTLVLIMGCAQAEDSTSETTAVRIGALKGPTSMGMAQMLKDAADGKTAICFMGHGTTADSNSVYSKMQTLLTDKGFNDYYVGTVEATPSLDDVLAAVQKGSYEKVILRPLMIVAGDHANNDMAGDEDDSWKSTFEKAGYTVDCQVEGLGQLEAIQQLFVEHAKAAVASAEAE